MKINKFVASIVVAFLCQGVYAQLYDKNVSQYCYHINNHPFNCKLIYELGGSLYGGLMMSSTSGTIAGKHNLGGLDLGVKLTNKWGYSCQPIKYELNTYLDIKFASYVFTSFGDDSSIQYTDYAAQVTIAPGVRYRNVSLACGPYMAYSAFTDDLDDPDYIIPDPIVSGVEFGLRIGIAFHFEKIQLGFRYDMGLSDQSGTFKKNDLMLTIGSQF